MKKINIITAIKKNTDANNLLNLVFSLTQQITENKFEILHTLIKCCPYDQKLESLLNILKRYKYIKVLNIKNKSINQARNYAIKSISADFIIHLETSDVIHPYFLLSSLNEEFLNQKNDNIILSNWTLFRNNKTYKFYLNPSLKNIKYADNIYNSCIYPHEIAKKYLFNEDLENGFEHWDILLRYISDNNKFKISNKFGFFKTDSMSGFLNCTFYEYKSIMRYFFSKYPNLYKNLFFKRFQIYLAYFNNILYNFYGKKYKKNFSKFYMNMDI